MADPVGLTEIADRLGVPYNTVKKWKQRYEDWPPPRWRQRYEWKEVVAWWRPKGLIGRIGEGEK